MTVVYLFPGQNSRYPGMIQKLIDLHEPNRGILDRASMVLQRNLVNDFDEGNNAAFLRSQDIQTAVFLANHMFLEILESVGIKADLSLGLSLGEYNHLVHIGALGFEEALRLVEKRGQSYEAGPRGAMASVFRVQKEILEEIIRRIRPMGYVEISNHNSPQQYVISGESKVVFDVLRVLREEFSLMGVVIEERFPMHSSLFKAVGQGFRQVLEGAAFSSPWLPYLPNRLGRIIANPTRSDFIDLLSSHIYRPVLWQQSIDYVAGHWPNAVFVEVGPKTVLYNLLYKKWHKNRKLSTDTQDDTEENLRKTIMALKDLDAQESNRGFTDENRGV